MRTNTYSAVRDDGETEIEVEYTTTPFVPATGPTYACGGQPAEGGEVEIIKAWWVPDPTGAATAVACELTDAEIDRLTIEIAENLPDDDDRDDYDDWRD